MESQVVESDELSKFKSPLRMLVRFFRRSRNNWKGKYVAAKTQIKRYKNQAADARRSREQWKAKAQLLEAEVQRLESERDGWEQDAAKKNCPR
jgi:chromosome segregation ATPase